MSLMRGKFYVWQDMYGGVTISEGRDFPDADCMMRGCDGADPDCQYKEWHTPADPVELRTGTPEAKHVMLPEEVMDALAARWVEHRWGQDKDPWRTVRETARKQTRWENARGNKRNEE